MTVGHLGGTSIVAGLNCIQGPGHGQIVYWLHKNSRPTGTKFII